LRTPSAFRIGYSPNWPWILRTAGPLATQVIVSGDRAAYEYLLRGIHNFPDAPRFAREIAAHGFVDVTFRRLSFGIVAIHEAAKPFSLLNDNPSRSLHQQVPDQHGATQTANLH
jgi:ubiE/COQ5 methyltransferase family